MRKKGKLLAGALITLLFFVPFLLRDLVFAENYMLLRVSTVSDEDIESDTTEESGELPSESLPQEDGDRFVERVTLYDSEGNEVTGEVSFAKQYLLRYDLISPLQIKLSETDVCMPPYMEKGIEYLLPGISNDFCDFTGKIVVKATDESGEIVTVATVEIGDDGIPVFTVETDLDKGSLQNGYFEISVNLNQETIGKSEDYTFELPKGGSLKAEIVENKKMPPTVSKDALEYDSDSKILTWRVTIQNAANPIEELYPLSFLDVIGEGQTYVEGSFQIITPDNLKTEAFQVSGNQLTWLCSETTEDVMIQYEYQTKIDVLQLIETNLTNKDVNILAENVLSVMGADDSVVADNVKASRTITEKSPVSIEKSGGQTIYYMEDEDTAEILWTITITNLGYEIKDLTVYDYFDAGSSSVRLKGVPVCEPSEAVNGRGYSSAGGISNGKRYQWSYHIGDVSENVTYSITYTTVIENYSEYVKRNNGISPRNQAWFDFSYPMGDDVTSKHFYGPVMTVDATRISANILEKTGSYDPANHRITWKIVVNPNQIPLPNAEIIDRIPDGQKYIDSVVTIADEVEVTTIVDEENNMVTFHFGQDGLSGRTATIILVTELEDSESDKWANNWSGRLENNVTLFSDVLKNEGVSVTGYASAKSQVITKDLGEFHYTDHTMPVTITINQNQMELTNAIVTDRLTDYGLELVRENGIQLNGFLLKEGTADSRPSYSYEDGILKIYPEETLSGKAVITLRVKVTDAYINAHRSENIITFENRATLTSDQYREEVVVQDTASMKNQILVKRGTIENQTGVITYTVEFNPALIDLPEGVRLTDTLPDGLLLKQSTVKLWIANVNDQTGVMTKTNKEATGYTSQIYFSGTDTVLEMILPGGKQAYILEYSVQIVDKDKAPFVNRAVAVEFMGDVMGEGNLSFDKVQVASARLDHLIYVKVKKIDASGEPLAGGVFALKQGEQQLLMGSTRQDGYLTFVGLEPNTEYTIVELRAPEGYVISSKEWTFTTGTAGGEVNAIEEVFVNQEEGWEGDSGDGEETPPGEDDGEEMEPGDSENTPPGESSSGKEKEPGSRGEDTSPEESGGGEEKEPEVDSEELQPESSSEESNSTEITSPVQEELERDRLPQTGGFWGSGFLYVIGTVLVGAAILLLRLPNEKAVKCGYFLLVAGVFFLVSTFVSNMYNKWRTSKEITFFETEMGLLEPAPFQEPSEPLSLFQQEKEEPSETLQELQDENGVFAVLTISSISCKEVVKEGCGNDVLAKALGHMEGTAFPGEKGNCVIAGHRNYSFGIHFNRLNQVAKGDEITIMTHEGTYTYIIQKTMVVEPEDVSVLDQTEEARLTLITCTPLYIGSHRLVVVAELLETET